MGRPASLNPVETAIVVVAAFVLVPVGQLLLPRGAGLAGLMSVEVLAVLGPLMVALAATRVRPGTALGLGAPPGRALLGALLAGVGGFYLVAAGLEPLQEKIAPLPPALREGLRQLLLPPGGARPLLVDLLGLALVPALCEEALFRGALLRPLCAGGGREARVAALLISSFAFGCFHFSLYKLLPTAALGAVMGLLALASGSIWPGVLAHATNNALVIILYRGGREEPPGAQSPLLPAGLALAGLLLALGVSLSVTKGHRPHQ